MKNDPVHLNLTSDNVVERLLRQTISINHEVDTTSMGSASKYDDTFITS